MNIYSIVGAKLKNISLYNFKLEKEIQTLVEANLPELFNLKLVKSELTIRSFRIDTLAYDQENIARNCLLKP